MWLMALAMLKHWIYFLISTFFKVWDFWQETQYPCVRTDIAYCQTIPISSLNSSQLHMWHNVKHLSWWSQNRFQINTELLLCTKKVFDLSSNIKICWTTSLVIWVLMLSWLVINFCRYLSFWLLIVYSWHSVLWHV